MKKHPTSFGVFKPVNHVVLALPPDADTDGAVAALLAAGFGDADIERYSPEQMRLQAEFDMQNATALASVGQELNLVRSHHELALQGHGFLVVHAPHDEQVERVTEVARTFRAARAQRYGRLMVEELVEVGNTPRQVSESPERGLDPQTRSGREGDRG